MILFIQRRKVWNLILVRYASLAINYTERRIIGYSQKQMFDVVYAVEEYPNFLPFCNSAIIHRKNDRVLETELWIGFPPLNEHYCSRVTSLYPTVIRSVSKDARIFHMLDTTWLFKPPENGYPLGSSKLHYSLNYEFKSTLYANLSRMFFDQISKRMTYAFLQRAEELYGPPSINHFSLQPEIITNAD